MSQNHQHLIKLRGLPWTVSADDIQNFLKEVNINEGTKGIHLSISGHDGRPNGEAFVECASEDDFNRAFDYNKNVMGHRYIEVFSAKLEEFEFVMKRQNVVNHDTFVKLRGLPWNVNQEDIMDFFEGMEIRNGKEGIHSVVDNKGKSTGEAFVQFTSPEDTENALKKNREKISHRYIEIFRSSSSECRRATVFTRPPAGMDRMMNSGNMNNNRGNFGGGNFGGSSRGGGPGRNQNNRNFRDKPYDTNWSSDGGSNRPRNNFNNMMPNNDSFNNGNNDSFGGGNNNFNSFGNSNNSNNNGGNGGNFGGFNNSNNSLNSFGGNSNNSGNRGFNNSPRNNFGGSNHSNDGDFNNGGNNQNNQNNFGSNNRNFGGNLFSNNGNNNGGMSGMGGMGNRSNMMNSGSNNMGNGNGNGNGRNNMGPNNMGGNRNWSNGNDSSDGGKFCVHLRGMPFDCGEKEVFMFFEPLTVTHCDVQYNDNGRHTGEADAFFGSYEDAQEAMKRHKQKMGARWIELFFNNPNSRNDRQMGGGMGGGMGNNMGNRNRF